MSRTVYFNGTILTMNEKQPLANTVAVENGRIVSTNGAAAVSQIEGVETGTGLSRTSNAGCTDGAASASDPADACGSCHRSTRFVDLKGAAMLPAFLDCHSHFSGYASAQLQVPLDEAVNFKEITEKIREFIAAHRIPEGTWIIGNGYDHNRLAEHAHPTAAILDQASPNHPVMITHQSCHMGVFNTAALQLLNVTGQSTAPEGGRIFMENGRPTGYMEENAFIQYQQKVPMPSIANLAQAYQTVQDKYASYGITTIQEGMLPSQLIPLYQMLMQQNMLKLDVVGYADVKEASSILKSLAEHRRVYKNHFKLGGLKTFLDGSPQGRTAWMKEPYADNSDYCGYPVLNDEQVENFVRLSVRENLQLLAHCNGDAAAEQYLRACAKIEAEGLPLKELRPVLIHGQLLSPSQLPEVRKMGIIPSFFGAHVYYWGDTHIQNFGMERAMHISPAASALKEGIPFTFHQDSPVIAPDMLETVWCASCRLTKGGTKLDSEAISVQDALKAVTVNAAYQYFEENEKGSIETDKRADFVILDQNPLAIDPMKLKTVKVLQTIKDGELIYEKA